MKKQSANYLMSGVGYNAQFQELRRPHQGTYMFRDFIKRETIFIGIGALAALVFSILVIRFHLFSDRDANDLVLAFSVLPVGLGILTTLLGSGIVYLLVGEDPRSLQFKKVNFLLLIDRVVRSGSANLNSVVSGNSGYNV